MADRRIVIFLVAVIIFLFHGGDNSGFSSSTSSLAKAIELENHALHVLNSSKYGDFDPSHQKWLNLTGLRKDDGYQWSLLDHARNISQAHLASAFGSNRAKSFLNGEVDDPKKAYSIKLYRNISGVLSGKWVRADMHGNHPAIHPNFTRVWPDFESYHHHTFERNLTSKTGHVSLVLREKGDADDFGSVRVRGLRAELELSQATGPSSSTVVLFGVHILETGSLILTTSSRKFEGIFALPHLAMSKFQFDAYQHRLNRTLKDVIEIQRAHKFASENPWPSTIQNSDPLDCEYVMHLQQHNLGLYGDVDEIEKELGHPMGRPWSTPAKMKFSMTLFSPDCGFLIQSKGWPKYANGDGQHLTGQKMEQQDATFTTHLSYFGLIIFLQLLSTIRQMKDASTPSTKNRISINAIRIITVGDGLIGLIVSPFACMFETHFTILVPVAFIAGITAVQFDLEFLTDIYMVHKEEDIRQRRRQGGQSPERTTTPPPQRQQPAAPIITAAGADMLPMPVTAGPQLQTVLDQDQNDGTNMEENSENLKKKFKIQTIFSCVVLFLVTGIFNTRSSWVRTAYLNTLCFCYLSCWTPQIYRNAIRNCRRALRWDFVISQSILRLLPIYYFYAYKDNLALTTPRIYTFLVFVGWTWSQIVVLAIQDVLGPRLFVPKSWVPPAYDYHPILREDDESTKVILGLSTATTSSPTSKKSDDGKGSQKRHFDCAICMQTVEVPVISYTTGTTGLSIGEGVAGSAFVWRRNYMITPCRHVYHTACLESAMRYRLQCPTCREGLPPL